MDYMNAKEAADKWGLSVRRVQVLCEQGRVDGVERLGNVWLLIRLQHITLVFKKISLI